MKLNILRGEMVINGFSIATLAPKIGVSTTTLSAKLNGHREFTISEVVKICEILRISDNTRKSEIFLS